MGKKDKSIPVPAADSALPVNTFTASSATFDTALTSLFASSSGPVTAPPVRLPSRREISKTTLPDRLSSSQRGSLEQGQDLSEAQSSPSDSASDHDSDRPSISGTERDNFALPSKKRRRITSGDDIEGLYMKRLVDQELKEQRGMYRDGQPASRVKGIGSEGLAEETAIEPPASGENDEPPQHESLVGVATTDNSDKSDRTVFLGNVSIEAIKSKTARKVLVNHLSSCLSELPSSGAPHKVESLRFRSTAFASGVGPKRAAYAKKELMEETTHSTNAYVVYTTPAAARKAAKLLNGSVVLDRHLRTDLVARPAEIDHRRCVFVGNLGFVDEEMIETETANGDKDRKRKANYPADAEEGLWRTFSRAGKVESVRVVRDRSTRVGKGIAYVQFHDENSVESALLYNEKKFPPLLPRKLRVTRARKPRLASKGALEDQGRRAIHSNNPGDRTKSHDVRRAPTENGERSAKAKGNGGFVFEGHRATKAHAVSGGQKKRKHSVKPTTRSSRRGAAFKAAGSKRQRD